jgi:hypothetical protein
VHFAWLVMWCVFDAGKRSEIGAREYIPSFCVLLLNTFSRVPLAMLW